MRRWQLTLLLATVLLVLGLAHPPAPGASPITSADDTASEKAKASSEGLDLRLPLANKSVRFAVIGDSGTGGHEQFQVAEQMERFRQRVNFDFVIMLGDNIYGGHRPSDYRHKFEEPYHALLDAGVKFYASLGNHDDPNGERLYKPFNMGGQRYYSFKKGDVEFFALDSNYMDPAQLQWLRQDLQNSKAKWKIAYFHHPLFNDGRVHGPDLDLRSRLTPLFREFGMNVVMSGHEHSYERLKPQEGIFYFVVGDSAKLIPHDFNGNGDLEKGFDGDRAFMLVEIDGDKLYFQTIARRWQTVDFGVLQRQQSMPAVKSASTR